MRAPGGGTLRRFQHEQLPNHAYIEEPVELGKPRRRINKADFYDYMQRDATLQINWLTRHERFAARAASRYRIVPGDPALGSGRVLRVP
jgi:hypothetical protein